MKPIFLYGFPQKKDTLQQHSLQKVEKGYSGSKGWIAHSLYELKAHNLCDSF